MFSIMLFFFLTLQVGLFRKFFSPIFILMLVHRLILAYLHKIDCIIHIHFSLEGKHSEIIQYWIKLFKKQDLGH